MDGTTIIGAASILGAAICMGIGAIGAGIGEGMGLARALSAVAQQPDESGTITRNLFVGMAIIESSAIYAFVISLILLFANPFWDYVKAQAGG